MAIKITPERITQINEIYYKTKNKAETARQIGCSAATVTRYLIPNYEPFNKENEIHFCLSQLPELDASSFDKIEEFGELCVLSDAEKEEIEQLWLEIH